VVSTANDYERLADDFMDKPVLGNLLEGKRQNGQRIRFDTETSEFCVASKNGILTYYKPSGRLIARKGGPGKYFEWECGR
jgi:hypothetical protein